MFHHQGSLPWTRLLLIYEWNVEHASKGVLLQKISSHSHRPLNFYPRKLETERRKLLCLTIFYEWSKAAVATSQLGSTRVSGSQHNTTTSASVAKKHIPNPFHSHTLGALSMMSIVHSPCGPRQNCGLSSEVEMTYIRWKRSFLKGFLSCPCLHWFRQRD